MRLSTRVRYAACAALDLALYGGPGPTSVREIVGRLHISRKYLEHLLGALQATGLVSAVRGRRGGYHLARPADEITLRDVYEAIEGTEALASCRDDAPCERAEQCVMERAWCEMYRAMLGVLESRTLADLAAEAEEARRSRAEQAGMYYI